LGIHFELHSKKEDYCDVLEVSVLRTVRLLYAIGDVGWGGVSGMGFFML
jgi:hypothetical protein